MAKTLDQILAEYRLEKDAEERLQAQAQLASNRKLMGDSARQLQNVLGTDLYGALNISWFMHTGNATCYAEFDAYDDIWIVQPVNAELNTWRFYPYDNRNTTSIDGQYLANVIVNAMYEARAKMLGDL